MVEGPGLIPTILLTGFLGAGKTTLLNRLIEHYRSRRTVLLINEFGQVSIDATRLIPGEYDLVELNKGSLFCICVRTDFIEEVERISRDLHPDLLLIEATGLADTSEMERMLSLPNLKNRIRLEACLCVADATSFFKIYDFLRAPQSQVQNADVILLNKCDAASPQELTATRHALASLSPRAAIIETVHCNLPLDILDKVRRPPAQSDGEPGEGRPDPVHSITLLAEGSMHQSDWPPFCQLFKDTALRVKGYVTIEGVVVHVDAGVDFWLEQQEPERTSGSNQLVIIGQDVQEEEIRNQWAALFKNQQPMQS
jgi:G3E family GTPase